MMVSTVLHTSLGYYILATGNLSAWDGLKKLLKLPLFHSMLWGLVFSFAGIPYPDGLLPTLDIFKGAYFVLGMAIIGLSISRLKLQHFDGGYILQTLIWRFPVWTLAALGLIWADAMTLGWLSAEMQALIVLYSAMPLPANSVAYAVQLNVHPERAASAVLASTMAALIYIPLIMTFYPALLP